MRFDRTLLVGRLPMLAFATLAQAAVPDLSGKDTHWIQDAQNLRWGANPDPQPGENIMWNGARARMDCSTVKALSAGTSTAGLWSAIPGTFRNGELN